MKEEKRKLKRRKRGENDDLMWEKFNLSTIYRGWGSNIFF